MLVASPGYLKRHGVPRTPADLAHHRALNFGHASGQQRWQLQNGDEVESVPIDAALCSNNGDVLRAAALHGNGITLLPTFLVGPDIAAGRLSLVLPDHPPVGLGIYALYAPNRLSRRQDAGVRRFPLGAFRRAAGLGPVLSMLKT